MQDDIEAPKPVAGAGTKPVAPAPSPLPPRKGAPPAKTITSPPVHRPRLPLSRLVILAGLAVVLIIGVGVVWYVGRSTGNSVRPASGATDALSVLPTQAQFVMRYSLGNDHDRQLLTTAWSRTGNKPSSATLVQGDPRALLALPDVKEFYYVILNNDPRSYLIVPVTDGTNKLFANNYDVVTAQQHGWYIVHSLNTDPYVQALSQGTLSGQPGATELTRNSPGEALPVHIWLSQAMVNQVRSSLTGDILTGGAMSQLTLTGTLNDAANQLGLSSGTAAPLPSTVPPSPAAQALLSFVPADSQGVWLGTNFEHDLTQWQQATNKLDAAVMSQTAITTFLNGFTTPYALYSRVGSDNIPDLGLVITLPAPIQAGLKQNDPTIKTAIEQTLPALVPLLIKNPPVSAASITFNDGVYSAQPVRYTNIAGQTVALDYSLTDSQLLIATSREGIQVLIDTLQKKSGSVATDTNWNSVVGSVGAADSDNQLFGVLTQPLLQQFIPHTNSPDALHFGGAFRASSQGESFGGVVLLPDSAP